MNTPSVKIESTEEAWEDRSLGADESSVAQAPDFDLAIDETLQLQPISIRLQKSLLDNLKALAQLNGLGYQPLIRQVLTRWVDCEMKNIVRERIQEQGVREASATEKRKAA
jgi:predicted DNA binding CopG/RHH family protein